MFIVSLAPFPSLPFIGLLYGTVAGTPARALPAFLNA